MRGFWGEMKISRSPESVCSCFPKSDPHSLLLLLFWVLRQNLRPQHMFRP